MSEKREEVVKILIELAEDVQKAKKIMDMYYPSTNTPQKIEILKKMFNVSIVDHEVQDEFTYTAILNSIIMKY